MAGRKSNGNNGANLGFEQTLWLAADKLRNNMDAAEYKHVVLGIIFLKYISDAFEERRNALLEEVTQGAAPIFIRISWCANQNLCHNTASCISITQKGYVS